MSRLVLLLAGFPFVLFSQRQRQRPFLIPFTFYFFDFFFAHIFTLLIAGNGYGCGWCAGAWHLPLGKKISLGAANKPLESFVHCGGIYARQRREASILVLLDLFDFLYRVSQSL